MLELKNIKKDYITSSETVHALKGLDITFRDKEFVSILGPSGCGKTTLLNIIGGLDKYTTGDLIINGRSTKSYKDRDWDVYRNHRVGFIFQSYNLIPHQTVLGNVELALTIAGIDKEERTQRAKRALDRVGLEGQYYKRPNQLSGGQCQRVAIARALVNDPEILLADEPTGALDTVTSVQIMNLIKEIAGERLVVMVTHNPELADEYSTRIVKLLDGRLLEDSNPVTDEEIAVANVIEIKEEPNAEASSEPAPSSKKKGTKERAKMSVFTAFRLSARNLISKKGRTTMVGFAGSIGIIGIAMVLAFRAGILGYVDSMQDDMLSGSPIMITESAFDLEALTGFANEKVEEITKLPGNVYVSSLVEYLIKTSDSLNNMMITNDITSDYINYVKQMPKKYYNAMVFSYGIDMIPNIFVDFKASSASQAEHISIRRLTDIYKSVLKDTEYAQMSNMVDMLAPSLQQAPSNNEYILSQYNVLSGKIAGEKNEVMLVLNSEDELSDLLLARLGYFTEAEFLEIINKASSTNGKYNEALYKNHFTYDELLNKKLTWYPTDTVFKAEEATMNSPIPGGQPTTTIVGSYTSKMETPHESGLELSVVGILTPKDSISYGALKSGIYYTEALTNYMLDENQGNDFAQKFLVPDLENESSMKRVSYTYDYYTYTDFENGEIKAGSVKKEVTTGSAFSATMFAADDIYRAVGSNNLANSISIYPISFDDKDYVTDYLDKWDDVKYTDTLELIVSMINTMIEIVTYALIAFTSISLVVSTVMIGIITYVSVVERIKEIGVIRSLGGRKRDVSNLFVAETFILGLLAGLIGVGFTYIASIIVNIVLEPIIGYANIAALPVDNAIFLVILSIGLTLISGLMPASSAAKKDPVVALRTE